MDVYKFVRLFFNNTGTVNGYQTLCCRFLGKSINPPSINDSVGTYCTCQGSQGVYSIHVYTGGNSANVICGLNMTKGMTKKKGRNDKWEIEV